MLNKVIRVRNVARLRKVDAAGDVQFAPVTLLFAENARGKTTFCDILRSLKTGDGDYIEGRETLSTSGAAEVTLLWDGSPVSYSAGNWSATHAEVEVFDNTFVHDNVYAGDYVEHQHKRNLYKVIVGEEGVRLARTVDELDEQIRVVDRELSAKRTKVEGTIPEGIPLEAYLNLAVDENAAERLRTAEATVAALRQGTEIATKSALATLNVPQLPANFTDLLSRKLDDVASDAEELVQEHLRECTAGASQSWLQEGLAYIDGNLCPFCGQSLGNLALIAAYRGFFSKAYARLKAEVATLRQRIDDISSDAPALRLRQALTANRHLLQFWSQFILIDEPSLNLEPIEESLRTLASESARLLDKKLDNLLEPVELDKAFSSARSRFLDAAATITQYNEAVAGVNALIESKKREVQTGSLTDARKQLNRLLATKARHEGEAKVVADDYLGLQEQKAALEERKRQAKERLDEYSGDVLRRFEGRINELLDLFGATFQIGGTSRQYIGGRPSSTYNIVIDGVPVSVGDARSPLARPAFRNTLSSGDRATLALAFFIARAELDPELSKKVLVYDDPFSSQDRSRRTCTRQLICRLSGAARQTIVLSHEPMFLRSIWDATDSGRRKALQFSRLGERNTTLNLWNIEDETRGDYFQKREILKTFQSDGLGNLRQVAQTIRPVLEEFLRFNWPDCFPDSEWLGDFIRRIEAAEQNEPLYALQDQLGELRDINDYSKRYHHAQNPAANTEPIDDTELSTFVRRTLRQTSAY